MLYDLSFWSYSIVTTTILAAFINYFAGFLCEIDMILWQTHQQIISIFSHESVIRKETRTVPFLSFTNDWDSLHFLQTSLFSSFPYYHYYSTTLAVKVKWQSWGCPHLTLILSLSQSGLLNFLLIRPYTYTFYFFSTY